MKEIFVFKKKKQRERERFKFYFKVKSFCAQQEEESLKLTINNKLHICGDELLIEWALGKNLGPVNIQEL